MPIAYRKGDKVRQVVPVIQGEIVDFALVDGEVQFCVEYTVDGEAHRRFFAETDIEKAE